MSLANLNTFIVIVGVIRSRKMGWIRRVAGIEGNLNYTFQSINCELRGSLGDLFVWESGVVIFLKEARCKRLVFVEWGPDASFCGHDSGISGSIKDGQFLDQYQLFNDVRYTFGLLLFVKQSTWWSYKDLWQCSNIMENTALCLGCTYVAYTTFRSFGNCLHTRLQVMLVVIVTELLCILLLLTTSHLKKGVELSPETSCISNVSCVR